MKFLGWVAGIIGAIIAGIVVHNLTESNYPSPISTPPSIPTPPPVVYATTCVTQIGSCSIPPGPIGISCYCYNRFTGLNDPGISR